MENGLLAQILRQIIAPDSGILLRREELQAALESARLEHPAESRYIDQLLKAVTMTSIGEDMLAARELDESEREKALTAIERNLIDYVGMQTAPARLVVETFVSAIDWDSAPESTAEPTESTPTAAAEPVAALEPTPPASPVATQVAPKVGQQAAPNDKPAKKSHTKYIIAVLVIIGAIAAFITNGMLTGGKYDAAAAEYLTIAERSVTTVKGAAKLTGEPGDGARTKFLDDIKKDQSDLRTVRDKLKDLNPPADKEKLNRQLLQVIDTELAVLENAEALIAYDERIELNATGPKAAKFSELSKAVEDSTASASDDFEKYDPIVIKDKNIREVLDYKAMAESLKAYAAKKLAADSKYAQAQFEEQRRKKNFDNAELKKKKEVVFLVTGIKVYTDKFEIKGNFYNGTDETISGVKDYLVDFTLLDGTKEVYTEKDILFNGGDAENMSLAPGASSSEFTLTHTVNIGKLTYTDYEVLVHKIHWKVRKVVKK